MNLSNSETTPSNILVRYYSNNASFHSTYRRQAFPFRDTLILYITNNPASSKLYQKMIQSCKHCFIKNPIIIVPKSCLHAVKRWYTQVSRPSINRPNDRTVFFDEITSKIWITDSLTVYTITPKVSFMSQISHGDAKSIIIYRQMFSFNDLMVIASKCEVLYLSNVVITNNDEIIRETEEDQYFFETAVSLEALFKALPNVKSLTYFLPNNTSNIITNKTAEELLKISHVLSLDNLEIHRIPEIFDIETFYGYIKVRF